MKFSQIKKQSGVSLLEVLVALFVLGVGLLGVLALQAESMKLNQQSYGSTQALFLANDVVERMRTNVMALDKDERVELTIAEVFDTATENQWKLSFDKAMPYATGKVEASTEDNVFKITITYPQQSLVNEALGDIKTKDVTYVLYAGL